MIKFSVNIDLSGIRRPLLITREIQMKIQRALLPQLFRIRNAAAKLSPYDPNRRKPGKHNRDTIKPFYRPGRPGEIFYAGLLTTSGYGGYLEKGTRKMRAQPYLRPAVRKSVGGIRQALRGCLNR